MNRTIKIVCLVGFAMLFLYGCSAQRGSTSPSASSWRNGVKGQWTLNSISKLDFPSGASVKSIFDEAPIECFIGSTWNLTGSGKGTITFSSDGSLCAPGAVRDIYWSINKEENSDGAQFQFKKIMPGDRAKDVTVGYRLDLVNANESGMTMRMPLDVGGTNPGYLIFDFSK